VAAVLDEAMGAAVWLKGHMVVAARMTVDFRRLVPVGGELIVEAWVHAVDGRKIVARGRLLGSDGRPSAEAEGLFVVRTAEAFSRMLEQES
jgi:acyl-coenzyme A thioesterase PaaI-like protein